MTPTDADACVVDTNVLVYSTVSGNPWHEQARQWLATLQDNGLSLCVTTQILREYLVVLTRGNVFEQSFGVDQVLTQIATYNQADFKRFEEIILEVAPAGDLSAAT